MRATHRFLVVAVLLAASPRAFSQQAPLAEVADRAVAQSQLTLPGSVPFHLAVEVAEKDSPESDLKAHIELDWVSPTKWRRSIKSDDFTQLVIVNGDQVLEQDDDDYYPMWLRDFVIAISNPMPMLQSVEKLNAQIQKPGGGAQSQSCSRLEGKIGVAPTQNSAYYVICFEGSHGLIDSIVTPAYSMEYKNYKAFEKKQVPRLLVTYPEPGTTIEGKITELSNLTNIDESMFTVPQETPTAQPIESIPVPEATLRSFSLNTPDIVWPTVRSGKTTGLLSIYVSVDRTGRVRETFPLNSDNAGLDGDVRNQVMGWQFKAALDNGVPVQVESTLTFAFNTSVANPISHLSDAEVRKLATNTVEATIPLGTDPQGKPFTIGVSIDETGKLLGVNNIGNLPSALFLAGYAAVKQWQFQPYIKDGKPDVYFADITFQIH